jgi:RNA polymerase sigma-70 factor (ECF subfamily)
MDAGRVYLVMATLLDSVMVAGGRFGGAARREALSSMEGKERAAEDRAAFVAMVERHGEVLYRVALALLRHPEDAVQNALLKLYRTGAWRKATNERAFLARTVWRAALDRYNRRARGEESLEGEGGEERVLVSAMATPEAAVMVEEREARLWGMVEALPLKLRAPLMLAAIEGLTTREIAAALELHEGTVRTRIHRAKVELKRRFEVDRGGLR